MILKCFIYSIVTFLLLSFDIEASIPLFSANKTLQEIPVIHNGRIRPMESYARQWLKEFYGTQTVDEQATLSISSTPLELLFMLHFLGHEPQDDLPKLGSNSISSFHKDELLKILPGKNRSGEWLPLKALKAQNLDQSPSNFTLYSKESFEKIREAYLALDQAMQNLYKTEFGWDLKLQNLEKENEIRQLVSQLAKELSEAYQTIAKRSYQMTAKNSLFYPSAFQLKAEKIYIQYPFIEMTMSVYFLSLILFAFSLALKKTSLNKWGTSLFLVAFSLHTLTIGIRCFILGRPPVSNMYETVIYVPWIAALIGIVLFYVKRQYISIIASGFLAFTLLCVLKWTGMDNSLENVQAVLNSQYWLFVHVLMVVGSYGAFLLSGAFAHIYLFMYLVNSFSLQKQMNKLVLHSLYLGTALLIPGTLLGGVWAAESWGRFWDWDPKEAWAFISICVYLVIIHAYRYGHIEKFGLSVGAIIGLEAITFTWYGVNYILGTGLHSYGFGSGGEIFYYLFLIIENLFLGVVFYFYKKNIDKNIEYSARVLN